MNSIENRKDVSEKRLLEVVEKLKPILEPLGYFFTLEHKATSSSGPFANGFFKKDGLQIGLIWRELSGLGDIVYENGRFAADHNNIMEHFQLSKQQKLVLDAKKLSTHSCDGSDILDAVFFDMKILIDDFLATDKKTINNVLKDAYNLRLKKFPWL